jgi:hypothetical protein
MVPLLSQLAIAFEIRGSTMRKQRLAIGATSGAIALALLWGFTNCARPLPDLGGAGSSTASSTDNSSSGSNTSIAGSDGSLRIGFGGMFSPGGIISSQSTVSPAFNNPITNALSCPANYTQLRVYGSTIDSAIYLCYKFLAPGEAPAYDFGGMYGYGSNNGATVNYLNPLTGAQSCPAGFSAVTVLNAPYTDYPMIYCIRPHEAGYYGDFKGVFAGGAGVNQSAIYANPLTGSGSCPAGSTSHQSTGTGALDWYFNFCLSQRN